MGVGGRERGREVGEEEGFFTPFITEGKIFSSGEIFVDRHVDGIGGGVFFEGGLVMLFTDGEGKW